MSIVDVLCQFFLSSYVDHRDLHSFPTRRSSDLSVKSFGNPVHCVRFSRDGLLYVCDRSNNRIQVFKRDGTFVKEFEIGRAQSELQSLRHLVCRLLLEKKKTTI